MDILKQINRAVICAKKGNYTAAEIIYKNLLAHNPDDIRVLPFLGWLYISMNRYEESVEVFEKVNRSTENLNIVTGLGLSYYYLGKYSLAYKYLKKTADKKPSLDVLDKLITAACDNMNQVSVIFNYAKKMNDMFPDSPRTWECYILAAICAGKFSEAENYCSEKLEKYPDCPSLYLSAGLIQEVVYSNNKLANACYQKSYNLKHSLSALCNLGISYMRLKDFDNAEKSYIKALEIAPEAPEIHTSIYILYAAQKRFEEAYTHFLKAGNKYIKTAKKIWKGENSINEVLYVYGDQGIGDNIMYSRYLHYLEGKFKKVIVAIFPSLITLFSENFSSEFFEFVSQDDSVDYDLSTLLSFLPYYLKMDYNHIPNSEGYLTCCQNPVEVFDNVFETDNFKAGFVWEAGAAKIRGPLDRSINIKLFKDLLGLSNITFYSLQVNPAMDGCKIYPNLVDLGAKFRNFYYTAAAINALDIVITVDTSVAHLAGAMGKKTLILVPYASDWRWFECKRTTEWYNSAELFTQDNPLDWPSAINLLIERVKELQIEYKNCR